MDLLPVPLYPQVNQWFGSFGQMFGIANLIKATNVGRNTPEFSTGLVNALMEHLPQSYHLSLLFFMIVSLRRHERRATQDKKRKTAAAKGVAKLIGEISGVPNEITVNKDSVDNDSNNAPAVATSLVGPPETVEDD